MKEIDTEAVAYHIRGLLEALGDDPDREGLKETPQRVARMYEEVFEGMKYTNEEIAQMFDKTFSEDEEGGADRYGDMVAKRLQLQERIGTDIADIITQVTGSEDVAVYIEGCHSCMTARGIRKTNTKTYTQTLRGRFQNESNGFMQWWR